MSERRPRVLMTGAAGRIGRALLADLVDEFEFVVFDRVALGGWPDSVVGDITDPAALAAAMGGVDAVVHLAANASKHATFEELRAANIDGTYEVLEAARRRGVRRVVFASSNRTIEAASPLVQREGVFPNPGLGPDRMRPDSLYGVSKVFGEALASYYADAFGVGSVSLRLGSVDVGDVPAVADKPRAWALWLSRRDLVGFVRAALNAPLDGAMVVNACSANTRRWWDLSASQSALGFTPLDDSEHLLHASRPLPPVPTYALPWGERIAALRPPHGHAFLTALGHVGFVLSTIDTSVAIDPFLTPTHDRLMPSLLTADDLQVDHIVVTHTHRDHLDAPTLETVARLRPDTRFAGPPTVTARFAELGIEWERITTLLPGESLTCGDVEVTAIPARHRPTTPDAQGYILRCAAGVVYHAGDTEYDPCLLEALTHRPDVLLVPINGRKGNMTAEQAAQLAADLAVSVVVPMHYGCLQPVDDMLDRFMSAAAAVAPASAATELPAGTIAMLPLALPSGIDA